MNYRKDRDIEVLCLRDVYRDVEEVAVREEKSKNDNDN